MTHSETGSAAGGRRSLQDRTVLVCGPADRTTEIIARLAKDRGARVALATPSSPLESLAEHLTGFPGSLRSEGDVDLLVDSVIGQFSRLDVVIAVVSAEPLGALHEVSLERWEQGIAEPLRRVWWLARRVVEEYLAAGTAGRLVLMIDPASLARAPNEIIEGALRSFARSFAREYGRRALACNLVVPSPSHGAGRELDPNALTAIAEAALFLASPEASFVNGEALVVDLG